MKLKLDSPYQSTNCEHNIKKYLYKKSYQFFKKHSIMRFSGPVIGLTSGCLTTARSIASIAEAILKGFINIFGAPFSTSCRFFKGIELLTKHTIINTCKVPFSILSAITGLFTKTFCALILSSKYLYNKWDAHALAGGENKDLDLLTERAIRKAQSTEAIEGTLKTRIRQLAAAIEERVKKSRAAALERARPAVL